MGCSPSDAPFGNRFSPYTVSVIVRAYNHSHFDLNRKSIAVEISRHALVGGEDGHGAYASILSVRDSAKRGRVQI